MEYPLSGPEALIIGIASLIAWFWVFKGPAVIARIKVWRERTPRSWSKRNHWS